MPFEMGKINHVCVTRQMVADNIVFYVLAVAHRYFHLPLFIHEVYRSNGVESVLAHSLPMRFESVSLAVIGSVAFNNSAPHTVNKIAYECGFKVIRVA